MMDRAVDEFERARGRMAGDFRAMIADSEDLLKAAATVSGEGFTAVRTKFEEKLRSAKAKPPGGTKLRARKADNYVHGSPWTVIGAAAAVGLLIGFLAAKR